jgi:DNA-binding response OmpR family regulator
VHNAIWETAPDHSIWRTAMPLSGRCILVVEHNYLVATIVAERFQEAGATTLLAGTVTEAIHYASHNDLSAAVLDHRLHNADSSPVCAKLVERRVPFVLYTGYEVSEGPCSKADIISKPASIDNVVEAVHALLFPLTTKGPTRIAEGGRGST